MLETNRGFLAHSSTFWSTTSKINATSSFHTAEFHKSGVQINQHDTFWQQIGLTSTGEIYTVYTFPQNASIVLALQKQKSLRNVPSPPPPNVRACINSLNEHSACMYATRWRFTLNTKELLWISYHTATDAWCTIKSRYVQQQTGQSDRRVRQLHFATPTNSSENVVPLEGQPTRTPGHICNTHNIRINAIYTGGYSHWVKCGSVKLITHPYTDKDKN